MTVLLMNWLLHIMVWWVENWCSGGNVDVKWMWLPKRWYFVSLSIETLLVMWVVL